MKISFGMITKDLLSTDPVMAFIKNAIRHGHEIHSLIVGYSGEVCKDTVSALEELVTVDLVNTMKNTALCTKLKEHGMSDMQVHSLVQCGDEGSFPMIPYGKNRNNVIMQALMTGVDILVFIDTDVYPYLMVHDGADVCKVGIDFLGRHLEYLAQEDVVITTSDYSGYYIIPPMRFEGMEDLFIGVQKESAFRFIMESFDHNCMVCDAHHDRKPFETDKILGGNMAIKLEIFKKILPFFSSMYTVSGRSFLTRGEDTLMGAEMRRLTNVRCVDIDTRIFHNTYGTYPTIPDAKTDPAVRDRFFRACMGWIGRNPFMNWLNGDDYRTIAAHQREHLVKSAPHAAAYFEDDRFLLLPKAMDAALAHLPDMIEEYHQLVSGWKAFTQKWDEWRD